MQVPPGLDVEGYWQPSYLNINVTLLTVPKGTLQVCALANIHCWIMHMGMIDPAISD